MYCLDNNRVLIHKTVSECLQRSCDYDGKVVITKRNRELARGDFELRAPKLGKSWPSATTLLVCKTLIEDKDTAVSKVHSTGDLLLVHLDRVTVYKKILSKVFHEGEKYGSSESKLEKCCVYSDLEVSADVSLDQLRSLLLSEHVSRLLTANGYDVCTSVRYCPESTGNAQLEETLQTFHISAGQDASPIMSDVNNELKKLVNCKWRHLDKSEGSTNIPDNSKEHCVSAPMEITLNLKQFMVDNGLIFEKQGYDKNINLIKVQIEDLKLKKAVDIATVKEEKEVSKFIHIACHKKEVQSQQIDLLSRIVSGEPADHAHIIHRSAEVTHNQGKTDVSAIHYYRHREEEMRRAFSMKYGEPTEGNDWRKIVQQVTQAAVKFDLLTTSCSSRVKLEMDTDVDQDETTHTGGGVFVMYNCARLAMLLSQFHKHVQDGVYSPLPNVEEIDFSALREQDEWTLLFNYIATYPTVVKETVSAIATKVPRPQVQTHKICQFLLDLVRDFSSYYSRTHVLSEARPHLLPIMYARLTLLTALQHVIHNALGLLNIHPLSHM